MNTKQLALDNLSIDEKNYIKYNLIHSGRNKSQVNGLMKYLSLSFNSLEDAEKLLDKSKVPLRSKRYRGHPPTVDKWNHPFVNPSLIHQPYSQCLICKELFMNHTKNIDGKKSHSLQKINKKHIPIEKEEKKRRNSQEYKEMTRAKVTKYIKICKICLEENKRYYTKLKCKHEFCNECLTKYFVEEIQNANVPVRCPEAVCQYIIDDDEIKRKVSKENFTKYRKFIRRREIETIPNSVQCPIPDCESYAIKPSNNQISKTDILIDVNLNNSKTEMMIQTDKKEEQGIVLRCIENDHEFCSNCLLKPHPGMPCNTFIENNFAEWKKDNTVRKCPKCGIEIIKQDGCNHMTCSKCKYQFCWICGGKYYSNHFNNPLSPCFKKQFSSVKKSDQYESKCNCCGLITILLKALGYFILGAIGLSIILCIPGLIAMLGVFLTIQPICSDDDDYLDWPDIAQLLFFFTCIALGIGLTSCFYFFIGVALTAAICLSPVIIVILFLIIYMDEYD